jgi:outer membrane receptor protein involved in Fe transport
MKKLFQQKMMVAGIGAALLSPSQWVIAQSLEEVIVTATKRDEYISDVPISMTFVSSEKIANAGIKNFEDLTAYIPNFTVVKNVVADKINIRGIQSGNLASFEQSVAMFTDGVYRGRGVQSRYAFLDVGGVEVLRGPQSTLFGKNTIGGALLIHSAKPTAEFESQLSVKYNTDFDETEYTGYISGPISETVAARFAFMDRAMDEGWVTNDALDQHDPATDEQAFRLGLTWEAGDSTEVAFRYEEGDWDNAGSGLEYNNLGAFGGLQALADAKGVYFLDPNVNYHSQSGDLNTTMDAMFFPGAAGNWQVLADKGASQTMEGDNREFAITVDHNINDDTLLTAIVAHSEYEFLRRTDVDYSPLPLIGFDEGEDFDQQSFELRVVTDTGNTFDYIAGMYWQQTDTYVSGHAFFNVQAIKVFHPAIPAWAPDLGRYHYLDQDGESLAFFGELTWNISDDTRARFGIRHSSEEKSGSQHVFATNYQLGEPELHDWYTMAPSASLPAPNAMLNGLTASLVDFVERPVLELDEDESKITWSAMVQHDLDDGMVYANVSTGFKAGGFNSFSMIADTSEAVFSPEEVLNFEVGGKFQFGRDLELNIAAFYTEYSDLQTAVFTGGTAFKVLNAAEAEIKGVEIDGRYQITDSLLIAASFGWVDFEYLDYKEGGCTALQAVANGGASACSAAHVNDLSGETSENTPELSASFTLSHSQSMGAYELSTELGYNWADEQYHAGDLDPLTHMDAYGTASLTMVLTPDHDSWDIALIGKNLTDKKATNFGGDTPLFPGANIMYAIPPKNISIRARYRF